ncbi:MAG: helix-turn-helix domain-containing protein [Thermoplasmatota archaeon]
MDMKDEGTGSRKALAAASSALALCLLVSILFSMYVEGQEEADTDGDGLPDDWEVQYGFNETDPSDASGDPDSDALTNLEEYNIGTNPKLNDTDSDGMDDGWEVRFGLDPKDPSDATGDMDRDGLPNRREYDIGTDPTDYYDPGSEPSDDDDDISPDDDADDGAGMGKDAGNLACGILFFIIGVVIVIGIIIGIYSKIRRDRILDHETRQRIVDYLRENPGAYYSQIRKDLDLAHGVLTHHINILEQQELLFSRQDRSYRRFFLDGMYRKGPIVTGNQKKVLDAIRRHPGLSQSEIGRKLGMGRMIVSYHINALEDLGLVEKSKRGRENLVYPLNGEGEDRGMKEDIFTESARPPAEVEA